MEQLLPKYVKAIVPVLLLTVMVVTGCRTLFKRPSAPDGMALVPAGVFLYGDTTDTYVSTFYISKHEVTWFLWCSVRDWAITNGYEFENMGKAHADSHPVHSVCWNDCVKWCNALSQGEGKTPAYYKDAAFIEVYTSGQVNPYVKWDADGYRLPTEAEWEKAARGGLTGLRFPWGDTITHSNANYLSQINCWSYDVSPTKGLHPDYDGRHPATSPVGTFPPNGYGIFDTVGNVAEWCWDRHEGTPLWETAVAPLPGNLPVCDPTGSETGRWCIVRGGAWIENANMCRSAVRLSYAPDYKHVDLGFRIVLPVR
jgi:formylglycine-generating enzyme required for sulfatase activity